MSRRTVDDKEIPLPYKWKIDEELKSRVDAFKAAPKIYSDPSTNQYWSQEGYIYYSAGNFQKAIFSFGKSLEIKPNVDACIGKARAFEELGKYDQAINCYNNYLEKQPDNQYEVAKVCWSVRYTEAMQSYEKSEKLGFDSLLDMVVVFGQMGKYSEVIRCSEKVIRSEDKTYPPDQDLLDPPSDRNWLGIGYTVVDRKIAAMFFKANALDAFGNFDEAIKYYDRVITARHYGPAGALYYRGRSKVKNGDIMGGLSDLKAAIERNDKYQKLANSDKDFESIRNDAVFRSIVTKP